MCLAIIGKLTFNDTPRSTKKFEIGREGIGREEALIRGADSPFFKYRTTLVRSVLIFVGLIPDSKYKVNLIVNKDKKSCLNPLLTS